MFDIPELKVPQDVPQTSSKDIPEYIKVDEKILGYMEEEVKYEDEDILVAIPINFKFVESENYQKGFLMVTNGAYYVFRKAILTGLQTMRTFNLLEVSTLRYYIATKEFTFIFDGNRDVYMNSSEADDFEQLAKANVFIMKTILYGIKNIQTYKVIGDMLPGLTFKEKPDFILKWRIIFLAHYYSIKSQQMMPVEYFNKWEGTTKSMVVIGPSLHPGKFAFAIGHAVAWNTELKTVVFQNFSPSRFTDFIEGFISNALTVRKIAFTDYAKEEKQIVFSKSIIKNSSVRHFQFLRVFSQLVLSFFENVTKIPQIENLILQSVNMTSEEFAKLSEFAKNNETMKKTLKFFELARSEIPDIHMHHLTSMANSFSNLTTIAIRNMSADGMRFLYAIARSSSPISAIHINCMNFRRPFKDQVFKYPSTLIHLDVSFSAFTDEAYVSLLNSITSYEMENQIIFESLAVTLSQPSCFQLIGHMDFDNCFSNIVELDFSGNKFPTESSRFLFAFIFTQKRIRLISLNRIECEDPIDLLKNVMLLVTTISLPALHMSDCNIDSDTFSQFLSALSVQNPNYIRSLTFANSKTGEDGLIALKELVSKCSSLVELEADGFAPSELEPLLEFWRVVSKHRTIQACDYPSEDLKHLGISMSNLSEDDQVTLQKVEEKNSISTPGKRDAFTLYQISKKERVITSAEIFRKCTLFKYLDNENDFATKEFKNMKA